MAKKVMKHERKESKSSPAKSEAEKRKARRIARKARAEPPADEAKGSDRSSTSVQRRGDSASDEPSRNVPGLEERVKTVITTDNLLKIKEDDEDSKVELCDAHYDALISKLTKHGLETLFTYDNIELVERLKSKEIEPLFQSQEALIKLSLQVIGTEGVVQHRCPVCAFQKFDFLGQITKAMRDAVTRVKIQREKSREQ